ncbi:reverse transcriptase domain-containing protein [Tanacetum coccineum]|uniref:Reverse transcriptase domain-containing protein n=1 Tax=Tanacetum coccineum TaxID=301880 RepID=A0ABQ5A6R7_9ASTR
MTWVEFKALFMEEFCPSNEMEKLESEFWNHTMVGANHAGYTDRFHELAKLVPHLVTPESKRIESDILKAGILTNEAVCCGTLTRSSEKRKEVEETSKQGGLWKDNKKAKVGKGFVATAPPRNENVGSYPKCAKCSAYHPEGGPYFPVKVIEQLMARSGTDLKMAKLYDMSNIAKYQSKRTENGMSDQEAKEIISRSQRDHMPQLLTVNLHS